jgi:adenine-specific DNA-methyltransferase
VIATHLKRTKKKRRGVFYTPDSVTDVLCKWAVRRKGDFVLEPSFGGCGFIQSLSKRFKELGSQQPTTPIFGCDIDLKAFDHLRNISGPKPITGQFIKGDFLKLAPNDFSVQEFDVVIGNPPYVSYHNMFGKQRKIAIQLGKLGDFQLNRVSSLWAYFVVHGFKFLKIGGRAAWVLPGSLLNSEYGKKLLHGIAPQFQRVVVVSLRQRLFLSEGTDESTEILLCDGWQQGPARNGVEVRATTTIEECQKLVTSWNSQSWRGASLNGRAAFTLLSRNDLSEYYEVLEHKSVLKLGDLASILIGIVTGANYFFVINRQSASRAGISFRELSLILSKFRFAPGLVLKRSDLLQAYENEERCLLLNRCYIERSALPVQRYLGTFPKDLIEKNATFAKRGVWHYPDDGKIPDGFFPYMNHLGPRIVLNSAAVNSTNTIHRLYFKSSTTSLQKKLAAISILTTFSQLSSEIEGRTYGSGVLKHEPSEAAKIKLIIPPTKNEAYVEEIFAKVENYLRNGRNSDANKLADAMLCTLEPELMNTEMTHKLETALGKLRRRRYS